MKKLIGLTGGENETFFKVLDVKETVVKSYPSIKNGKVQSPLDVAMDAEFFKHKKEVSVPGYYAVVSGNAVSAEVAIMETLGDEYRAMAVNPNCVQIWAVADYNEQIRRVCNA